jgi:hypothetical protein
MPMKTVTRQWGIIIGIVAFSLAAMIGLMYMFW